MEDTIKVRKRLSSQAMAVIDSIPNFNVEAFFKWYYESSANVPGGGHVLQYLIYLKAKKDKEVKDGNTKS